jgi:hypothetical protein
MMQLHSTPSYRRRAYEFTRIQENDLAEGLLILDVVRGNRSLGTEYALQCDRGEDGTIRTVYLAKMHSEDGEVYGVEFAQDGRSRCSCMGYRRHGRCKHNDSIRELIQQGRFEETVNQTVCSIR